MSRIFTWVISNSIKSVEAIAVAFSLVETANANHLDLFDYIKYLLEIMPNIDFIKNPVKLDDFLPWSKQTQSIF